MNELVIESAGVGDLIGLLSLYLHLNPDDEPCPPNEARELFNQIGRYGGSTILVGRVARKHLLVIQSARSAISSPDTAQATNSNGSPKAHNLITKCTCAASRRTILGAWWRFATWRRSRSRPHATRLKKPR